jgi:hypothetical protein
MATFLELCRQVSRDSGTISDLNAPVTVTGQQGRLSRIVQWTADAYHDIQTNRDDWRWLKAIFTGQTIADVQSYNAAAMGITERFDGWIYPSFDTHPRFSVFLTADGPANEGFLRQIPWDTFRQRYMFGANSLDRGAPVLFSVTPQDELIFYPTPDAQYTIRGDYRRSPQILSADADIPEMPIAHHDAIKWQALILLGTFDEAFDQIQLWQRQLAKHMAALERKQTERITLGGPLA